MDIITIIIPIATLISGAILQFAFSIIKNNFKYNKELEFNAYSKYLESVSNISISLKQNNRDEYKKMIFALAESKTKIVSYGKASIIKKLAALEKIGCILNNPESIQCFLELIAEIRKVTKKHKKYETLKDYEVILFGVEKKI